MLDQKEIEEYSAIVKRARKPANQRNSAQKEFDRAVIAQMYLEGKTQADMADQLGLTRGTVRKDIKAIQKQWVESSLISFESAKAQQLARIDHLEHTYWQAYQDSFSEDVSTTQYLEREESDAMGAARAARAVVHKRPGKASYAALAGVQWCITERNRILGLYSAVKFEAEIRAQYMASSDIFLDQVMDAVRDVYGEGELNEALDIVDGEFTETETGSDEEE